MSSRPVGHHVPNVFEDKTAPGQNYANRKPAKVRKGLTERCRSDKILTLTAFRHLRYHPFNVNVRSFTYKENQCIHQQWMMRSVHPAQRDLPFRLITSIFKCLDEIPFAERVNCFSSLFLMHDCFQTPKRWPMWGNVWSRSSLAWHASKSNR